MPEHYSPSGLWLRLLLEPVARFCLRRSMKLQEISEALKEALVRSAQRELKTLALKPTVNRISVITGIHRSDVRRLLATESPGKNPTNTINRVIGVWQNDKRFVTTRRLPRTLSFDGKTGEFADLVGAVTFDLNP